MRKTDDQGERREDTPFDLESAVRTIIAKTPSHGGGSSSHFLTHALDTAAVAEWLWRLLASEAIKQEMDEVAGGQGRGLILFRWICALHDFGKIAPLFQARFPEYAAAVRRAGLTIEGIFSESNSGYRHERAGAYLISEALKDAGWSARLRNWVWPLIAGHHGDIHGANAWLPSKAGGQLLRAKDKRWREVRAALLHTVSREVGYPDWREAPPAKVPRRSTQLALCGLLKLADWLSSGLAGISDPKDVTMEVCRRRAAELLAKEAPAPGWGTGKKEPGDAELEERYGKRWLHTALPGAVLDLTRRMPDGGLLIVESPGDTLDAGLLSAEIMAARTRAQGVFVGTPEWSAHHDVFRRVRKWLGKTGSEYEQRAALLHELRALDPEWSAAKYPGSSLGHYVVKECPGESDGGPEEFAGEGRGKKLPVDWFFSHTRGLLAPFAVAPTYQVLAAAVRTQYVMIRMAGLLGKVHVLDIADVVLDDRMRVYLLEALRWLGQARVPMVLMASALSPGDRGRLLSAWLGGAVGNEGYEASEPEAPGAHPRVTAAWIDDDEPRITVRGVDAHPGERVTVELAEESADSLKGDRAARQEADRRLARLLADRLGPGQSALVVRNSAERAQSLHPSLREAMDATDTVVVLHTQLAAGPQAVRARQLLERLAPGRPTTGGERFVLVADQLVERSFPVSVDLVVSDAAPVEQLLARSAALRTPSDPDRAQPAPAPLVVTGYADHPAPGPDKEHRSPVFPAKSARRYERRWLVAALALAEEAAAGNGWALPRDAARIVARAHEGPTGLPPAWRARAEAVWRDGKRRTASREAEAAQHTLARRGEHHAQNLAALSYLSTPHQEWDLAGLIQGSGFPVETLAVIRDDEGYRSLLGVRLPADGSVKDLPDSLVEAVRCGAVRLPPTCRQAGELLAPLPAWAAKGGSGGARRLCRSRALVLDPGLRTTVSGRRLRYDHELGLVDEGPVADSPAV
ncbi:CRISPR-associated endonuclease Cas3'' [Streptomyces albidoflavus]|uniref:CRISPR-associated endonuclease Cas3'' n=1 Tax=Streptomyces albidoflavus TaxID=1886 RepID=UPI003249427E